MSDGAGQPIQVRSLAIGLWGRRERLTRDSNGVGWIFFLNPVASSAVSSTCLPLPSSYFPQKPKLEHLDPRLVSRLSTVKSEPYKLEDDIVIPINH
jgi:hypothetical protein